ncbi:RNA polymerase sigma factor [Dyadobacter fanqingshengii]|uniref:RNA polymerase subunit sigma n=1 Tax=Dyadobacter fanqingshengii TaxID=2906443 RepID=A0A9X1THV7_9BACT|nr:DUF6596 domain-containing protein [Dyadobacter fanqingshengii]MCF0042127.1 RNA polymerase subunit sigma [Dyadobacter fanqingshengii]USJ35339.1 RNA polymerase subunit sigma [Dyadobacter fanqingshengii]
MESNLLLNDLLPDLFRQEYAKMTAVLCRRFGLEHFEIAEDIASETFLKASEQWALDGIPANPRAWLYTVAKNKAYDHIKHLSVIDVAAKNIVTDSIIGNDAEFEFSDQIISDSQLAMIFAVCNPANSAETQISLALQILCGFSIQEIADALLTKTETIKKRLLRGKTNLRNDRFELRQLSQEDIEQRMETVLKTLYLFFNEGYYSKTNNQIVRKTLCAESLRLTLVLTENAYTNTASVNALLALMCFQSSRLNSRISAKGEIVLFDEQDQAEWDVSLIERGKYYLINAAGSQEVSKYHFEAGIAYWHATSNDESKWPHILQLYNQLILIEYTPVTALNSAFAFGKVYGNKAAIKEVEKLNLSGSAHYHATLGYLYSAEDVGTAIIHYKEAIRLTKSRGEKATLQKQLSSLFNKSK